MLSTLSNLGIPDLTVKNTLTDLREEGGSQMATINSTMAFEWKDGNLPLGFLNVTVGNLSIKSEYLMEIDNTAGYLPRVTGVTTFDFDLVINLPLGPEGPTTYNAKGRIQVDSSVTTE